MIFFKKYKSDMARERAPCRAAARSRFFFYNGTWGLGPGGSQAWGPRTGLWGLAPRASQAWGLGPGAWGPRPGAGLV